MALKGVHSAHDIGCHARSLARRADFVMRCYSRTAHCLRAREAGQLSAAGLMLGAYWDGDGAALSRRQGVLDAAAVLALARALGQPAGSAVFFAAHPDVDLHGPLAHYFDGLRAALGGPAGYVVGAYGAADRCAWLVDRGLAARDWAQPHGRRVAQRHALTGWPAYEAVLDGKPVALAPVIGRCGVDDGLFRLPAGRQDDRAPPGQAGPMPR